MKKIIGTKEKVLVKGKAKQRKVWARIDTGATLSSIDKALAKKLDLGPVLLHKIIKQAHGKSKRPVVAASIEVAGKKIKARFTLADRKHMKFDIIIGRRTLKQLKVLVDPTK